MELFRNMLQDDFLICKIDLIFIKLKKRKTIKNVVFENKINCFLNTAFS